MTLSRKNKKRRYKRAAAKCSPGKLRDAITSKWTKKAASAHRSRQLGTFGPASEVRHIDPNGVA